MSMKTGSPTNAATTQDQEETSAPRISPEQAGIEMALDLASKGDLEGALQLGRVLLDELEESEEPLARMAFYRLLVEWSSQLERPMDCKKFASRAVQWGSRTLGETSQAVLMARNSELYWMCEVGYDRLAARRFPALLEDVSRALGADSELAWAVRVNSAMPLKASGDFEGASMLYRELIVDMARILPADDVLLMTVRDNLAEVLELAGHYGEAKVIFDSLLEEAKRLWGGEDPRVLRIRTEIARLRFLLGDEEGAVEEWKELGELSTRLLGRHHPRSVQIFSLLLAAALDLEGEEMVKEVAERFISDPPPEFDALDLEGFALLLGEEAVRKSVRIRGAGRSGEEDGIVS